VIRTFLLLPLFVLSSAACDAQAQACGGKPRDSAAAGEPAKPTPALTGRVVDRADLLSAPAEAELTARLAALEKATTDQLVVVTVPSLEGEPIDHFGLRLGNGWAIGQKGVDNGVLLIVAPREKQARIEVGYGLEGLLTDERAAWILKERALPNFAKGKFERGIDEGVAAIGATLESDRTRPRCRQQAAA
jgi:uncharacterized protein